MTISRTARRATLWLALAACTALVPVTAAVATAQDSGADLIPRADIFGNPDRTGAQISPDGQWVAYIAPKDGVLNIWVAPVGDLDAARAITNATDRPIRQMFWANNSSVVLYLNDKGGDENPCSTAPIRRRARTSSSPISPTPASFPSAAARSASMRSSSG